ncbi:MAG: anhydro-N-acetylmuramic acid kinase [Burkholderiales bacterium]
MSGTLYAGLMSGTSLDGVDAILLELGGARPIGRAHAYEPFDAELRTELLALNTRGTDELERAAACGNRLAHRYAVAIEALLARAVVQRHEVRAIGCHGQTVRHRPEAGYTLQIGNAARLAELSGITVVADFRSRDVAAGGQGAPLAPAFHAVMFGGAEHRAVLNLGGMANLTWLPAGGEVRGFDTGPGNCLMDLWAQIHLQQPLDRDGAWAARGKVDADLLEALLAEPYFAQSPPKSTGRDLFNEAWLRRRLPGGVEPQAVQATLLELTARTIERALRAHCPGARRLIACGGGVRNASLMARLRALLAPLPVETSEPHGLDPAWVEAAAFAWLAREALEGRPGNLPAVTGARGPRILGAIYPA